jgi:NitT/TauT family transport system ATP-binding protein
MEVSLKLENISKSYGDLEIFSGFNISFIPGKINCILGPSGCGKTSLLNIISGSEPISSGNRKNFEDKKVSYVFQDPRLLPWKTVEQNIAFVLKDQMKAEQWKLRVKEYIDLVQLTEFSNYFPGRLSGGMKQRVSLARAFSYPSDIILMDEPFKALDRKLKNNLMRQFRNLWKTDMRTVIYVTHEVEEALNLGHKIFVFSSSPVKILKEYRLEEEHFKRDELLKEIFHIMDSDGAS